MGGRNNIIFNMYDDSTSFFSLCCVSCFFFKSQIDILPSLSWQNLFNVFCFDTKFVLLLVFMIRTWDWKEIVIADSKSNNFIKISNLFSIIIIVNEFAQWAIQTIEFNCLRWLLLFLELEPYHVAKSCFIFLVTSSRNPTPFGALFSLYFEVVVVVSFLTFAFGGIKTIGDDWKMCVLLHTMMHRLCAYSAQE